MHTNLPDQRENRVDIYDFGGGEILITLMFTPRMSSPTLITFFSVTQFKDQKVDQKTNRNGVW